MVCVLNIKRKEHGMKYKKITECEMCSFIAKHSDEFGKSVSIPDVKTILQAYESFLKLAAKTKAFNKKTMRISLGSIGYFYFVKYKGLKAGEQKRYNLMKSNSQNKFVPVLNEEGKPIRIKETVEEDEPDYYILKFKANPTLQKEVREVTSEFGGDAE
jgi:hypothetical protein